MPRPAPEDDREQNETDSAGKKKYAPVQAGEKFQTVPALQKPPRGHQHAAQGAGEQKEQKKLPQEGGLPPEGQPDQPCGGRQLGEKGRRGQAPGQGAQRPVGTAQKRGAQQTLLPYREPREPRRHVERQRIAQTVEQERDIQIDDHCLTPCAGTEHPRTGTSIVPVRGQILSEGG